MDGLSFEIKKPVAKAKPSALNISGKWKGVVSGPMGELETTLEFIQEGNEVRGSVSSEMGKWEIRDGLLSGTELTFIIDATVTGEAIELAFSGTAEKDSLEGTITFEGGSAELKATKIPEKSS